MNWSELRNGSFNEERTNIVWHRSGYSGPQQHALVYALHVNRKLLKY